MELKNLPVVKKIYKITPAIRENINSTGLKVTSFINVEKLQKTLHSNLDNFYKIKNDSKAFRFFKHRKSNAQPNFDQTVTTIEKVLEDSSSDDDAQLQEENILFEDEEPSEAPFSPGKFLPAKTNQFEFENSTEGDLPDNAQTSTLERETANGKFDSFILPKTELVPSASVDIYKRQQKSNAAFTVRNVRLFMKAEHNRFGFSVLGGSDEGLIPMIDTIKPGKMTHDVFKFPFRKGFSTWTFDSNDEISQLEDYKSIFYVSKHRSVNL